MTSEAVISCEYVLQALRDATEEPVISRIVREFRCRSQPLSRQSFDSPRQASEHQLETLIKLNSSFH
jgi:hypothetical protein